MEMNPEKFGGYNAHFLHELLDEYECPVCIMALREPVITLCGHRLCFSCSEEMIKRNNGVLICPLDKTILNSEKVFPDKFTERAILQLKVKCDNFLKGCQWTGELKTINNHLTSCEYQEVKCLNEQCSTTLLRKELSDHMEKHCIYRLVTCQYCKQKIIFCDIQIHEEKCECLPLCCVNQCGIEIMRKEMSFHITDSCANTIIPCQYLNIGCKFKGMRKEHETHADSSMQTHLSLAVSKLDALENKITLTLDTLENKIASKVNALENKIMLTVNGLENKIMSKVESLETKIASKAVTLENKITSKVESFENKNATEVVALENKIMSKVESLETIIALKAVALENKITSAVESLENKNASEVVALEMKITSTVDALKNELMVKVDAQQDKIMLHEKNLEVIKAFLVAETIIPLELAVSAFLYKFYQPAHEHEHPRIHLVFTGTNSPPPTTHDMPRLPPP
ncbi:TNF receptor-associated factor 3-like isoform X3 [Hydra vulgaris]|uniref:TNF receptor-associated factor 3-like isoform X3 n=1 Tax=Hydra vulgaris TaxID=6087 RepID=A0ABM4CDX4_HYDVU